MALIGRMKEQALLRELVESKEAQFVALYGRRRVGKTFLIREFFSNNFDFSITAAPKTGIATHLADFADALREYGLENFDAPSNWREAFKLLRLLIEGAKHTGKKVIFIDEMPWFDTHKSGFLSAFEHFWNSWASAQHDILLIACGSAASWMTNKLFRDTGGLHNRVTMRMNIQPFTLQECEEYFLDKGIVLTRYQIIESYMILGGVPYYLSLMSPRLTFAQNIDRMFFAEGALLKDEYDVLYASLFKDSDVHVRIVEALGLVKKGLTREALSGASRTSEGGGLTKALQELELSGFVCKYPSLGKRSRDALYRLIDPFTLFYLNFIPQNNDENYWQKFQLSPAHNAWSGYAFENVCLRHTTQIKNRLGAQFVIANTSAWHGEAAGDKAQIDLAIDRKDGIVNLCEMKYTNAIFVIDKDYNNELRRKRTIFKAATKTKKALHMTLVTVHGLAQNEYAQDIQYTVTANDLFAQ
jgi:AAA+ ATPase superfamily predicted ATPase